MCVSVAGASTLWTDAEDEISLEVEANAKFSVWVSFCEIYNKNIHDLLEVAPGGALRRTALRLSQDVKGNAFVKGLIIGKSCVKYKIISKSRTALS